HRDLHSFPTRRPSDLGEGGRVIALDILDMPPLAGVEFLHGDFREDAVLSRLESTLAGEPVDLVLSDMAPNKSGMDAVDQPRMMQDRKSTRLNSSHVKI